MIKRLLSVFLAFCAALSVPAAAAEISAECAIVYEPYTGTVLYEKNADTQMLIASTTKIMTALVVLERCRLEEYVPIKPEHCAVEGSSMYLKAGENYTVLDLLYGLMLASGNDAAAALADYIGGSMEGFAALMNEKCASLKLENTHFANAHGLDAEAHYSTAHDLAVITAEAMKNETFCKLFGTASHTVNGINYINHNKLLSLYEGCIGGKTGYTEAAGRILVSCAERDGLRLICVTICAPDDWNDHMKLYDEMFGSYEYVSALPDGYTHLSVISGFDSSVELAPHVAGLVVPKDSTVELQFNLPRFVFAPVEAGEIAGESIVCVNGQTEKIPIVFSQTVHLDGQIPLTPMERFKKIWYMANKYGVYYSAG